MTLEEQAEMIKEAPLPNLIISFEGVVDLLENNRISLGQVNAEDFAILRKELQRREIVTFN